MENMTTLSSHRWSGSLFNFFDPSFWGVSGGYRELDAWAQVDPDRFWRPALEQLSAARVSGVDLAMDFADWNSAQGWAGSAVAFGHRLSDLGLTLSASYQSGHSIGKAIENPEALRALEEDVVLHARFIAEAGGDLLLIGSPLYGSAAAEQALYDEFSRIGGLTAAEGVGLALHTEAYARWSSSAEIDDLMLNTDSSKVTLCPDTGHIALQGDDPVPVIERHLNRIRSIHVKDSRSMMPEPGLDPDAAEERMMEQFCMPHEGVVRWDALASVIEAGGYTGWLVAEIDNAPVPGEQTHEIVRHVENELANQTKREMSA